MAKKKRALPRWMHQPAYLAVRAAASSMTLGDPGPNLRAAKAIGRIYAGAWFNRGRLNRAVEHLGVAFPEWGQERRRAMAVRAYEHLFMLAVEMAYTTRLLSDDGWSSHVRLGNLKSAVGRLLSGRPYVLISGHMGNWELLGAAMALLGFPIHAVYRPLDMKPMDDWVRRTRQSHGLTLVDKFGAMRVLPRVMEDGGAAGFVADQNSGDRGLFVPFFNRLASSYKAIGLLALRYDAVVICGQARRLTGGSEDRGMGAACGLEYQIDVVDVFGPEDWAGQPDPLFYITARYRRALEEAVRRSPEQYLWMHRYWKSRPRHEKLGKPFPSSLREKIAALPWTTAEDVERVVSWSERDARELAGVRSVEEIEADREAEEAAEGLLR